MKPADRFRLSPWMRFWQLEVPFAMPALLWNMMMSMSGSWFFVVASEAISVGHTNIALPGIGSYIALAIEQGNLRAIGWAIAAMLIVILLYDQLIFRPLVVWSDRFRIDQEQGGRAAALLGADDDAALAPHRADCVRCSLRSCAGPAAGRRGRRRWHHWRAPAPRAAPTWCGSACWCCWSAWRSGASPRCSIGETSAA